MQPMQMQQPQGQVMMGPGGIPMMAPPVQQLILPVGDIFGPGPLQIKQKVSLAEALGDLVGVDYDAASKYDIFGAAAGRMYMFEVSGFCERQICREHREADVYLKFGQDEQGPTILKVHKNRHLGGAWDCCCRLTADVYDGQDKKIGDTYDEQCPNFYCSTATTIKDENDKFMTRMSACMCQLGLCCPCCADVEFPFVDEAGNPNGGAVRKVFGGLKECYGDANNFDVIFPDGADLDVKSMMVAMAMLIDLMYFEGH